MSSPPGDPKPFIIGGIATTLVAHNRFELVSKGGSAGAVPEGVARLKKEETVITLANDGMHNQKAYRKMKDMLNNNNYTSPRLYHLIFMGSEFSKDYQAAMKALCLELRRQNIPCQWKGCLEVDDEKGLHFHVFILTEAKYRSPCAILNHNSQQWLDVMMQKRGLTYHIAPPENAIHRTKLGKKLNYATLAGEKLADCLVWISYLVKRRSKCDAMEHIYFGSRPSRAMRT